MRSRLDEVARSLVPPGVLMPTAFRIEVCERRTMRHYHQAMPYALAAFAIVVPVLLVVQAIRGRVRVQCCSVTPERDVRMRSALESERS